MSLSQPEIRAERPGDEPAIRRVQLAAFPTAAESQLVDNLRNAGRLSISLVASVDNLIVGHIAFSPVTVDAAIGANSLLSEPSRLGLAPLAVLPQHQRTGVGTSLGHAGMAECRRRQTPFVVVLGSPIYYARLGFSAAAHWNLRDEYQGGPGQSHVQTAEKAA